MSSALKQAKELASHNNKLERKNVELQYQYNKSLAEQDRDWQEMMSNSAHQRQIKDLKAAGLNPVLSVTGGNGASTPSGSATSVSKPNTDMSLPSKVIDMAIASMNNANAIRIAELQTENALKIAELQTDTTKETNPYYGLTEGDFGNKVASLLPTITTLVGLLPYVGPLAKGVRGAKGIGKAVKGVSSAKGVNSVINSVRHILKGVPYKDTILYANKQQRKYNYKDWQKSVKKRQDSVSKNRSDLYNSVNGNKIKYLKKLFSNKKYWSGK